MRLEPLDQTQIESIVSKAVQDAVDFVDSEIAPQRIKAQRYFDNQVDIGHEEGRSGVVASKCREAVRGIKPSIQRIFLTSEKPVEFVPKGPEDVAAAEQATSFIAYKFQKHNGYKVLNDVFQDAMVKKTGIAYVYYNDTMKPEIFTMRNLTDEAFTALVGEDDVEVLEHEVRTSISIDAEGIEIEVPEHDVKLSRSIPHGEICIESVPPEDFFVDRNARGIDSYYVCGHSTEVRVSDILAMGFSIEDLDGLDNTEYSVVDDEAEFERRGYAIDDGEDENVSASSKLIDVSTKYWSVAAGVVTVPLPSNNIWSNTVPLLAILGCLKAEFCVAPVVAPDWLYQVWTVAVCLLAVIVISLICITSPLFNVPELLKSLNISPLVFVFSTVTLLLPVVPTGTVSTIS